MKQNQMKLIMNSIASYMTSGTSYKEAKEATYRNLGIALQEKDINSWLLSKKI